MKSLRRLARSLRGRFSADDSQLPHAHFNLILPGKVRQMYSVPDHIPKPYYLSRPIDSSAGDLPQVHRTEEELGRMRAACRLARHVLETAGAQIKPGVTTEEIDLVVFEETVKHGAYPSPLGYKGFPKSCCTSVNNVVCHGIPDDTRLLPGDTLNLDVTVFLDGYHGDTSSMFTVGGTSPADRTMVHLVHVTEAVMHAGIAACRVGSTVTDVQHAYYSTLEQLRGEYEFVLDHWFCSHGIGTEFHAEPNIGNKRGSGERGMTLVPGQTLTIEPILLERPSEVVILEDKWTCTSTLPLARSAQFEHTVLVTEHGPEILTKV